MTTNSFLSKFIESQNERAKAQNTAKTAKTSINSSSSKSPKYYLTSKADFEAQKVNLLAAVRESVDLINLNDATSLFTKYFIADNPNTEFCSVMVALKSLHPKALEFMLLFPSGIKFEKSYKVKQMLFFARLNLLDKCSSLLPAANQVIFRKSINVFVNKCCSSSIAVKVVNDGFGKVSPDLLEEFIKLFPETSTIITEPKYNFIHEVDPLMTTFLNCVKDRFRNTYITYKQTLSLLRTTLELIDPVTYSKAVGILHTSLRVPISGNLIVFTDFHYFLHILRSLRDGITPSDVYPLPQFSPEDFYQLTGYLSEISDLLTIMSYINVKFNVNIPFL